MISCSTNSHLDEIYRSAPESLVFHNVTILDVVAGKLINNQQITILNGIITAIRKQLLPAGVTRNSRSDGESVNTRNSYAENALHIDATGKYLIPGLIDSHVHIYSYDDARQFVRNGVTTVQNMWDLEGWITYMGFPNTLKLRKQIENGFPQLFSLEKVSILFRESVALRCES